MIRLPRTRHALMHSLFAVVLTVAAGQPSVAADAPTVDFNRDIRPILSDKCYQCHGPDENERQADLRLDRQEDAVKARDAGHAVVGGSKDASLLYQRISADDPAEKMPPAESGKQLTAEQIEMLARWIDEGAQWQGHWSFIRPARPSPPPVEQPSSVQNAIDQFVLAKVIGRGVQPAPEAAKETLLRRVTFDLTGLPPTLKDLDAFLADRSENAYEKVVDRLLKSPHYGEHRARYWLDAARYGDTHGLHLDNKRQIWPYREWLIRAFNDNLPFDQFTVWQLAGDLLPDATLDQQIASGFNRCNVTTSEGGSIAEEYRVRYAIDRVETTSTVWLGLTAGCAVCHDHKFDPLSQREFYRLYAYFYNFAEREMDGNVDLPPGPSVDAPTQAQQAELAALARQRDTLTAKLDARRQETVANLAAWEAKLRDGQSTLPQAPSDAVVHLALDEGQGDQFADAASESRLGKVRGNARWIEGKHGGGFEFDGRTHAELGDVADFEHSDKFSYGAWVRPTNEQHGAILSRMDDSQKHRGYDLYLGNGLVYVHIIHSWDGNAIRLNSKTKLKLNQWQHVMMTYDGSGKAAGVKLFVDGQPVAVAVTHDSLDGSIKTEKALRIGSRTPGAPLQAAVDDVRIYARQLTDAEVSLVAGADPIRELIAIDAGQRSESQQRQIQDYYLARYDRPYQTLAKQRQQTEQQLSKIKASIPKTLVMGDRADRQPVYRLIRGQYDKPDTSAALEPGLPAALPALPPTAPANRLALAQWLVSPENPLPARVTVNRFWQQLFGTGIVKTTEDFGSQGEWPSHPELLDWLAVEFVESGWDVKRLLKLMVMSRTYRQSSATTPEQLAADPQNRLLSRGPRFRFDAETIRDNALALSGLLHPKIGGASVRPYQPSGLWKAVGYSGSNTVNFTQDHGEGLYRRSMYIFWKRTAPPPTMQIFDAPSREYCVVRRERTNTPSAALVLLNDVQFVEAARHFGQRIIRSGGSQLEDRLAYGFRLATCRRPEPEELSVLAGVYNIAREKYQADPAAALALLQVGESPRDESLDPGELAAWTIVASTILNLDETITKG